MTRDLEDLLGARYKETTWPALPREIMLAKIKTGRDVRAYEDTNRGYQHEGEKRFSTDQEERVAHRSHTTDAAKRGISPELHKSGDPRDSTNVKPGSNPTLRASTLPQWTVCPAIDFGSSSFSGATDIMAYLTVAPSEFLPQQFVDMNQLPTENATYRYMR